MAITSGYFNSVNGDRKYNADQMSEYFEGIINEGVCQHIGGGLAVTAGTGMAVSVASGKAFIGQKWIVNDAALTLSITAAADQARIDAVVLRRNNTTRSCEIAVKNGTPSASPSAPSMTRTDSTYEMALAYVNVAAGATSVTVTDKRADSSVCGWATVAQSTSGEVDQMLNDMKTGFDGVEYDSPVEMVTSCDQILDEKIDDLKSALSTISEATPINMQGTNEFIKTNNNVGETVDLTPQSSSGFKYAIIDCTAGDKFTINATGGASPRVWAFVDSNNVMLSRDSVTNHTVDDLVLEAPANSAKLIINDKSGSTSFIGQLITVRIEREVTETQTELADIEEGVDYIQLPLESGYIETNVATINVNTVVSSNTAKHSVSQCSAGDIFTINGTGGLAPLLWAFADSSNNRLAYSKANETRTSYVVEAPENAAYIVINTYDGRHSYKGTSIKQKFAGLQVSLKESELEPNRSVFGKSPIIPVSLSWEDLFSIEKTNCIHGDNFHRADSSSSIGNNGNTAYPMNYTEYHEDVDSTEDIQVGIANNMAVAFDAYSVSETRKQIRGVDAGSLPYKFSVEFDGECMVALGIKGIDNYFSCKCTNNKVVVSKVGSLDGSWTQEYTHNADISVVDFYVFKDHAMIVVGGKIVMDKPIVVETSMCGMVFQSDKLSDWKYKSFCVFVPDKWKDFNYDRLIEESGVLAGNQLIGTMEFDNNVYSCQIESTNTRFSEKALRFDLKYTDTAYRSEISFPINYKKRLGGISSEGVEFDLYFPSDYDRDSSPESLFQLHHASDGLNYASARPNIILFTKDDHLWLTIRGSEIHLESIADEIEEIHDLGNIEKATWHRYSLFWIQSYIKSIPPITALYIDGELKVCSRALNEYNTPIASYPKFGMYKWDWRDSATDVSERVAFFDNINYWQ